ncbi:MAG: hypothetical protein KKB94_03000, partial [Proteobacteria bacterium]|nr:hypothetical protein [Pseudomonadota bacterium]
EAGRYLQKEALFPVPGSGNLFAIWSRPEVNKTGTPLQAKLGGTGLGLVSLLSIEAVQPGFMPMDQLRGMGRFVLYMQKPEGNFHSKYIPATGGLDDQWESLFYPGEAALGLAMLYEKDPDPLWLEGALKALTFLAHNRRDAQSVPEDHWALLATERLFLFQKPLITDELGQLLLGHADQICRSMLTRYEKGRKPGNRQGRILQDLSVTQVSCTLEGLLAALSIFPQNHVLRPRLENTAKEGVTFLLGTQISQGDEKGAFPRNDLASHSMGCGQGRIDPRNAELRIDYTQHALSALVRYLKLGEE